MLGLHPFDTFQGRPHHASSAPTLPKHHYMGARSRRAETQQVEPYIEPHTTCDAYLVSVRAVELYELTEPKASLDGCELTLRGVLKSPAPYEYATASRTGVYTAPGQQLIGVAPGRAMLRGTAPTHGGWVELEEGEGWVRAADLQLLSRPPVPQRFATPIDLPADALLQQATSRPLREGGLLVTVPRARRKPPPPKSARAVLPLKRPVPSSMPATARPAWTPQPTKVAAAAVAVPSTAALDAVPTVAASSCSRRPSYESTLGGVLPPSMLLLEAKTDAANVQRPVETMQNWLASPCGGFVPLVG